MKMTARKDNIDYDKLNASEELIQHTCVEICAFEPEKCEKECNVKTVLELLKGGTDGGI